MVVTGAARSGVGCGGRVRDWLWFLFGRLSGGSWSVMEEWRFGFTVASPASRGYGRAANVWWLLFLLGLQVWIDVTALPLALVLSPPAFFTLLLVVSPYSVSTLCRVKVTVRWVCRWVWCVYALWAFAGDGILWPILWRSVCRVQTASFGRDGSSEVTVLFWGWRLDGGVPGMPCWYGLLCWRGLGTRMGWSDLSSTMPIFLLLQWVCNVFFLIVVSVLSLISFVGCALILISLVGSSGLVRMVAFALRFHFFLGSVVSFGHVTCCMCKHSFSGPQFVWVVSSLGRRSTIIKWLLPPRSRMKECWTTRSVMVGMLLPPSIRMNCRVFKLFYGFVWLHEEIELLTSLLCLCVGEFSSMDRCYFKTNRVASDAVFVFRCKLARMYDECWFEETLSIIEDVSPVCLLYSYTRLGFMPPSLYIG